MRKLVLGAVLAGMLSLSFLAVGAQPSQQVDVTPGDMQGWAFTEEVENGSGSLVNGPDTPPIGSGSANMTVDETGRQLLGTQAYAGTRLDEITNLGYSTYRSSGGNVHAISLQFDIDTDLTDGDTIWQGRLVYEPYYTQTVVTGSWQTWDPMATGANWWFSGAPGNAVCPISDPCTWSEVLDAFPNAGVRADIGVVQFKAGGPWPDFDGNVDAFVIGVNGSETTYNFEAVPTSKEQCKDGGWREFEDPSFRNQGLCIKYVVAGP